MPETPGPVDDIEIDALVDALRLVLSKGLPVTNASAGELLPQLRSVYARAVVPNDRLSRIAAFNSLLPRLIAAYEDSAYREATQALFGLAAGTRGAKLTERRRRAAQIRGYSTDHFREYVESEMLTSAAVAIYNDLLRYHTRVQRATGSLEATGDTPTLGPEHLTHEEELVSRIWQHVYGLRAELIAYARLDQELESRSLAEEHRQAAFRMESALRQLLAEYSDIYGELLIRHGEAEFTASSLERIVGWKL